MEDRAEILGVIARLAHVGDREDLDEYARLYTDDATWEYSASIVNGSAAIIANAQAGRDGGRVGPDSGLRHVITTVSVVLTATDAAEADSYVLVYATTSSPPTLRSMVRYHDTLRRLPDGWRVARRQITPA